MMAQVNHFLNERTQGEKYATLFYGVVNSFGAMRWTNAAHCAPILAKRDGRMETLRATGMPVGILDSAEYEVRTTQLDPRDKLVVYSDGLSEAQNPSGQFFEFDRIKAVVQAGAAVDASTLHAALLRAVQNFIGAMPQRDDMTLVVAEYMP
jgi:serine phosphatase RsbU (regulator of sigma subunit)